MLNDLALSLFKQQINNCMNDKLITDITTLGTTWETNDPFLFCAHHHDKYPKGNAQLGPDVSLKGRNLGQDFTIKDDWRMYHGNTVPGFPGHPHRGFETITIVLDGFVDHSDSYGASGRYGKGDVQWMTAGSGLQHSEMFPLLNTDKENHLELFQIWLNLPKARKFCKSYYNMLWAEDIPVYRQNDINGIETEVKIISGSLGDVNMLSPAPDSWAANVDNEVGIWLIKIEANGAWTIPSASSGVNRSLYFYRGSEINIAGVNVQPYNLVGLIPEKPIALSNGGADAYCLLLQGKPINENVVQHGPFVMNSDEEIYQALSDYRKTHFGGWPWQRYDNVHPREWGRFAKYADGCEDFRF